MALLNRISIKWKISLVLVLTGFSLVLIYVVIAKNIFESDKIAYVFDSQGARLDSIRVAVDAKIEKALLTSNTVAGTFDPNLGAVSTSSEHLFNQNSNLIAIELWNESDSKVIFHIQKSDHGATFPAFDLSDLPIGKVAIFPAGHGSYLFINRYSLGGKFYQLRSILEVTSLLPEPGHGASIAIAEGNNIISISDLLGIEKEVFKKASQGEESSLRTQMQSISGDRYLISVARSSVGNFKLLAVTPEAAALGALTILFKKSIIFLLLSTFGLVAVSLILARTLTEGLLQLTRTAKAIGAGNFEATTSIDSKDEIGLLAEAFSTMSKEIKRLLFETREKTRMEQELKTASLVQECLLPEKSTVQVGSIQISGVLVTASECGGDWWFYFSRGDETIVIIADATGHGTPPALITAAARSIFSRFENEDASLSEMMKAWDKAVLSCSKRKVLMTGVLLRVNNRTGEGVFINAAHEPPFVVRSVDENKFKSEFLLGDSSARIGDGASQTETHFKLQPNDAMILYTDGLFAINTTEGKTLSDKRLAKSLVAAGEKNTSAELITKFVLSIFDNFRANAPLEDDVSVVTIRRIT